ncbi:MAG: hypothetical protein F6K11_36990, partial [Leptolyngbya sp. SIO3F4]|nr:hypothetical protein [Leptolyngbya sp. SIO3F4]
SFDRERLLVSNVYDLLGFSFDPLSESKLHQCIEALPIEAKVTHIGFMLSRPLEGIRLIIKKVPPQYIVHYLKKNGWTGTSTSFSRLIKKLSELVDSVALAIDVGKDIYPKIGLECSFSSTFNQYRWQIFLDYLVEESICTRDQKSALLNWSGLIQKEDFPDLWPDELSFGDTFLGSKTLSVIWRRINHVKIVYEPKKPIAAKAYLAFGHTWIDSSQLNK